MQIRDIAIQCLRDEAEAILQTIPQLDDAFDRAVELMLHCTGKVVVTGVGKSGHVGAKIAATLASTGTPSFYLNPLDAFHGDLGMVSKGDVVVALSNSGMTDELLRIIHAGLDDRVTALLKLFVFQEVSDNNPDYEFDNLYFMDRDESEREYFFELQYHGETVGQISFDRTAYDNMEKMFAASIEEHGKGCVVINAQWAGDVFEDYGKKHPNN